MFYGNINKSIPEAQLYVRRYTVSHPVAAPNQPAPAYDGLTEIWFDDFANYEAFYSSKNYLEKVKPDETWFRWRA
ncbi:EthD domain-containing protein [Caballeronia sordidicola]|uniref:EthD domain-containing protein n=1 Tax=Caballeronia sordidicola TaxID=196367 RepID=UPI00094C0D44|nr:EthD domain-containing protein [Caballeronia sordidicola]